MKKNKILLICLVALLGLSLLTACRSKDEKKQNVVSDKKQEIVLPKDDLEDENETKQESGSGATNAGTKSEDNSTTSSANKESGKKQENELPKDDLEDEEEEHSKLEDKDTSGEDSNTSDDKTEGDKSSSREPIVLPGIKLD